MFYIHPWEVDPAQPRLPVASRMAKIRHYINLATTERKLIALLRQFSFGRIDEVVANQLESGRSVC
jgi:hypothetical protein